MKNIQTGLLESLGLMTLAAFVAAGCSKAAEPATRLTTISAAVETVGETRQPLIESLAGVVRARLNSTLSAKFSARVAAVYVKEGDPVKAGQLVLQLDPRDLTANVQAAEAGVAYANVGVASSRIAETMQYSASGARVRAAQARLDSSIAGRLAAQSRLDLVLAGPRLQEKEQSKLATESSASALKLADLERQRSETLYKMGAVSKRDFERATSSFQTARATYRTAVQAEKMSVEGSRPEEIRAAQEGLTQASAGILEARAVLAEAKALMMQTAVQREATRSATALKAQAAAGLSFADVALSESKILAPFDGVVTLRSADPGTVAVLGTPLLNVSGGGLRLEFAVPEGKMEYVTLGQKVGVHIDSLDEALSGTIVERVPQADAAAHTFLVRVAIPGNARIKPGMYGRAELPGALRRGIWLKAKSIVAREGLAYVFVVGTDHFARMRILSLGPNEGGNYEILSGLQAGERIISAPDPGIVDGSKVSSEPR